MKSDTLYATRPSHGVPRKARSKFIDLKVSSHLDSP
jgi:hypothetical protein